MSFIIRNDKNTNVPEGFHRPKQNEIANEYFEYDLDGDCIITKNEWMLTFIKMLGNDLAALKKEGPDSIMKKIQELSDEFDYYDTDNNGYLEFQEYKQIVENNIFISD